MGELKLEKAAEVKLKKKKEKKKKKKHLFSSPFLKDAHSSVKKKSYFGRIHLFILLRQK